MGTRILDKSTDCCNRLVGLGSQGLAMPVQLILDAWEPFACSSRVGCNRCQLSFTLYSTAGHTPLPPTCPEVNWKTSQRHHTVHQTFSECVNFGSANPVQNIPKPQLWFTLQGLGNNGSRFVLCFLGILEGGDQFFNVVAIQHDCIETKGLQPGFVDVSVVAQGGGLALQVRT